MVSGGENRNPWTPPDPQDHPPRCSPGVWVLALGSSAVGSPGKVQSQPATMVRSWGPAQRGRGEEMRGRGKGGGGSGGGKEGEEKSGGKEGRMDRQTGGMDGWTGGGRGGTGCLA